jgi:hypothetical protein
MNQVEVVSPSEAEGKLIPSLKSTSMAVKYGNLALLLKAAC